MTCRRRFRRLHNALVTVHVRREFGRRLRTRRREQQATRGQLARQAHVSRLFLACCEHGLTAPRLLTLLVLAEALAVDAGELVQGLRPRLPLPS